MGYPEPPEYVTRLPMIEPPDANVGVPTLHETDIYLPLLSPISLRTRTIYGPVGMVLGTVKLAETASHAVVAT